MIDISFKSTKDLLTSSNDLLAEIKGVSVANSHSLPQFNYYVMTVLTPPNYEWKDTIINLYPPISLDKSTSQLDKFSIVVHGHEKGQMCFARDMCYVLNYAPVGNESAAFLKRWEKRNNEKRI